MLPYLMRNTVQTCTMFHLSGCSDQYAVYFEHNAEGATPHITIKTVEECADKCRSMPNCIAFDYDRNTKAFQDTACWIHTNVAMLMKAQSGVDHYLKGTCESEPRKFGNSLL